MLFRSLVLACCLSAPAFASADLIVIEAVRAGSAYVVRASVDIETTPALAWQVVTDYGRLAEFIPDLKTSRVVQRDGNTVVVDQIGEMSIFIFSVPIEVRLQIEESPPARVVSRALSGSFLEMHGSYELQPLPSGVRFLYEGRLVPDFSLPPLVDLALMRTVIRRQFAAMVGEIRRRTRGATRPSE